MLWLKALHLITMVAWFSGLFYLPRLFVYHANAHDSISLERFKVMERKLYYYITTPAMVLTLVFGIWLMAKGGPIYKGAGWLHTKVFLVVLLVGYHHLCGRYLKQFARGVNQHSAKFYRIFNEVPTIFLILIILLAVLRPF